MGLLNSRLYGTNNNTQRKSGSIKSEETYKQHTDGTGGRNRQGQPVPVTEKTLDMALDPETYANTIAEKYGINLRGAGQDITIKYNPDLRPCIYGRMTGVNPNVIEIEPDALMSETELANTIAVFQLYVLFVGKRRNIYIFIEIWREMNEEVCGYGVVYVIISHTLCIDCQNGGKILEWRLT